jgi:hypothetical protein
MLTPLALGQQRRNDMRFWKCCLLIGLFLLPELASAQSAEKGQAMCYQIEKAINALVDYTHTSCLPTNGKSPGSHSFVLISSQPVFSVEPSKKAWLLVAVAVVGNTLNKNTAIKAGELWLSDVYLTKNRVAHVMSASTAKSLQRRIKADQISLETMYSEILKNLTPRSVEKK